MHDLGNPSTLGVLYEDFGGARVNRANPSRDLSNASWTKSNMTCTKNATGFDGTASAASNCLSTAPNATVCLSITAGAARNNTSLLLKKVLLTGDVLVSEDNLATSSSIGSCLSATQWNQASYMDGIGFHAGGSCHAEALTGTAANPTVCVKLTAAGDTVVIDLVQNEAGMFPSTPIRCPGLDGGCGRAADAISFALSTSPQLSSFAWNEVVAGYQLTADFRYTGFNDLSNRVVPYTIEGYSAVPGLGGLECFFERGGAFDDVPASLSFTPTMGPIPLRCSTDSVVRGNVNGNSNVAAATVLAPSGLTTMYVGGGPNEAAGAPGAALISRWCADVDGGSCPLDFNRAKHSVLILGDSILAGNNGATLGTNVGSEIARRLQWPVYNAAVAGSNCSMASAEWFDGGSGRGFSTLVIGCGTNDIAGTNGDGADASWNLEQGIADSARAQGTKVLIGFIPPRDNSPGWTGAMQYGLTVFNQHAADYCASAGSDPLVACVNRYFILGACDAGDCTILSAGYDSGDHVHLNVAGTIADAIGILDAGP